MWQLNANCAGTDPSIFHSARKKDKALALSLCANCVVKSDCLEFALSYDDEFGIYGGTTPEMRKAMANA
jgi:hypothetical protein